MQFGSICTMEVIPRIHQMKLTNQKQFLQAFFRVWGMFFAMGIWLSTLDQKLRGFQCPSHGIPRGSALLGTGDSLSVHRFQPPGWSRGASPEVPTQTLNAEAGEAQPGVWWGNFGRWIWFDYFSFKLCIHLGSSRYIYRLRVYKTCSLFRMPPKKHLGYTSSTSVENGRNYIAGVGGQSSMNRGLKKINLC